jgi:cobalt/nickel transport system permease protein
MTDAIISPAVGGSFLLASSGLLVYSSKILKKEISFDSQKIPLMGVLGAFIFAAQMINFTIPGTGSSGHLGGGMLLAILLGTPAAFLTMASILVIQALFFADGGLLALGCNIFNLGFFTCFIAYPFLFKRIAGDLFTTKKVVTGSMIASIIGLQLGSLSVVGQTYLSGKSDISFMAFLFMMQPIHLVIGIVEGIITAGVVSYILNTRPEIIAAKKNEDSLNNKTGRKILIYFIVTALFTGGILSWFASSQPDGLEWSILKSTGSENNEIPDRGLYSFFLKIQEKSAFLPDYGFKTVKSESDTEYSESVWPSVDSGTTLSGILGVVITILLTVIIGLLLRVKRKAV